MFGGDEDRRLESLLKSQCYSFLFSAILEASDGRLQLASEQDTIRPLREIELPPEFLSRFLTVELPAHRELEEMKASEELSVGEKEELLRGTLCHRQERPCDWVLYEIYKRKVRTLSLDEAKRLLVVKLLSLKDCIISDTKFPDRAVRADVRIYATMKCIRIYGDGRRAVSPVVSLFMTVELLPQSDGKTPIINLNISRLRVSADGTEYTFLQDIALKAFRGRFLQELSSLDGREVASAGGRTLTGRFYRVCSLSLDSFKKFSPDPLLAYFKGTNVRRDQVLVALYLFNILFSDYDIFERLDPFISDTKLLESSFSRVLRIVESSTALYAAPGCTVTVDDFGDPEVSSHISQLSSDECLEFDHDLGGPRNEVVYHTLVMSTISSRNTILSYYERVMISSLRNREGGTGQEASSAAKIRSIVERAIDEFSIHTFGPFRSVSLEREYDEINRVNGGEKLLETFQKNVDFYGKYAIEEQHHSLMREQSERLKEERELLSELRRVLSKIDASIERTEKLTAILIVISAVSVIIALLFSLHVL